MTDKKHEPLPPSALYAACDRTKLSFADTSELDLSDGILGQQRALDALGFGTGIDSHGYNIFAMGAPGTGKFATVKEVLDQIAATRPPAPDWVYVNNFEDPHKPGILKLSPGYGARLRKDLEQLVEDLGTVLPAAFQSEDYQSRIEKIEQEFTHRRDQAFESLAAEASQQRVRFLSTPTGFAFAPLNTEGKVIDPESFEKLTESEQQHIEETVGALQKKLQRIIREIPKWQKEVRDGVRLLEREIGSLEVGHLVSAYKKKYQDQPAVVEHLIAVENDIVDHVREFRGEQTQTAAIGAESAGIQKETLSRYRINVIVEHGSDSAAPVIYQDLPSFGNLTGRVEHRAQMGMLLTDFTLIKGGDLHRANGGYLVLDAHRLLFQPFAWDCLKRALRSRLVHIESMEKSLGLMSTISLEPEPIPLDIKVVLTGERMLYYLLKAYDPEFSDLFKVVADFDERVNRDEDTEFAFARLLGRMSNNDDLPPLTSDAVARVVEQASRMTEDSSKLSTRLRDLSELLHEAAHYARMDGRERVDATDVQRAIDEKIHRHDRVRDYLFDAIKRGAIKIATEGERVGQINALSVLDLGGFSFGQPSRITATHRMGDGTLVDIQRETELGGSIHTRGVLILAGYLRSNFALSCPFSVSASLVFEQSYGMVDGDSASLAELCALLSSLGGVPIHQQFAITGSINQLGEVQAIGGVNQKIEGFFDVCNNFGLTGEQAVIIPSSNVGHLMLREDVRNAVSNNTFSIYPVQHVNDAIELLTGITAGVRIDNGDYPAGSVYARVEQMLIELALARRDFTSPPSPNEDEQT